MVQCDSHLFERRKSRVSQASVTMIGDTRLGIDSVSHSSTGLAKQSAWRGLPIRPNRRPGGLALTVVCSPYHLGFYARVSIGTGLLETLPSIGREGSRIAGLVAC